MTPILEVDLRPVDGAQPERVRGDGELHRSRHRVVICQGERFVAQLERRSDQLVWQRCAVQERER
jgi:hypothetical protein